MILLGTAMVLLSILVFLPLQPLILKLYQAPDNTLSIIYLLLLTAIVPMPFFWPVSNIMPCILRAAGDATFSSIVSLLTMWAVRVGFGWLLSIYMGFGVQGVWIAMGTEWAVRTLVFACAFTERLGFQKRLLGSDLLLIGYIC